MATKLPNPLTLPEVLGLPPWDLDSHTNKMILNSMPTAEIVPCTPSISEGYDLYTLVEQPSQYRAQLRQYGYDIASGDGVKVAFLADSFPTDTFQNEYGENFLQKFTNVASEGAATIAQMMGADNATGALQTMINRLKNKGGLIGTAGGFAQQGKDFLGDVIGALAPAGSSRDRFLSAANELAAGGRLDFPQIWKASSFSPSYTMTVRLYNPAPQNDLATHKYIIGPIAALMLLGIPQTKSGGTYRWPYLHKVKAPGIYNLDPAFISNVTVIKGGDQQQISYSQRMGVVDVRIDFGSLYNTMVAGKSVTAGRPTLAKYLKAMTPKRAVSDNQGDPLDERELALTPKRAPTVTETTAGSVGSRTNATQKQIQDELNLVLAARTNRFTDQA